MTRPFTVRRSPLWRLGEQFRVWTFRCDFCDSHLNFAKHANAVTYAQEHAESHG